MASEPFLFTQIPFVLLDLAAGGFHTHPTDIGPSLPMFSDRDLAERHKAAFATAFGAALDVHQFATSRELVVELEKIEAGGVEVLVFDPAPGHAAWVEIRKAIESLRAITP